MRGEKFVDHDGQTRSDNVLAAKRTDTRFPRELYDVRESAAARPPGRFRARRPLRRRTAPDAVDGHARQQLLAVGPQLLSRRDRAHHIRLRSERRRFAGSPLHQLVHQLGFGVPSTASAARSSTRPDAPSQRDGRGDAKHISLVHHRVFSRVVVTAGGSGIAKPHLTMVIVLRRVFTEIKRRSKYTHVFFDFWRA